MLKIKKFFVLFSAVVTALSISCFQVSANNHTDQSISGYARYRGPSSHWGELATRYEDKEDSSATYIYNQSDYNLKVHVYVEDPDTCNIENMTKNDAANIPDNSQRFIKQYVYKYGYSEC